MAPDVSRRSSRRLKAFDSVDNKASLIPLKKSRRAEVDTIEGVQVYSFEDELQMEYFANLEEPLPRKQKTFRGFNDEDDSVNLLKHYFDRFYENFLTHGIKRVSLFQKKTPKKKPKGPNRKANTKQSKKARSLSNTLLHDVSNDGRNYGDVEEEWGKIEGKEDKVMDTESEIKQAADSAVKEMAINVEESSDDDGSLQDEPVVQDEPKAQDDSIELVNNPMEIITISDNESDDDCMMVSDPSAPIPRPVAVVGDPTSCCPTCGKYKSAARRSESDKDSALGDEILITTDGDDTMVEADKSLSADPDPKQCDSSSPLTVTTEFVESAPQQTCVFKPRPPTNSRSLLHQPDPNSAQAETSTIDRQKPSNSPAGAASSLVSSVHSELSVRNKSLLPRIIKKRKSTVESEPSLIGLTQTTLTNPAAEVMPTKNRLAFAKHDKIQRSPSIADIPSTSVISAGATTLMSPSIKSRASMNTRRQGKSDLPSACDPKHSEAATPTNILKQSTLDPAGALAPALRVSAKSSGTAPPMESKVPRESSTPSRNRLPWLDRVSYVKRLTTVDITDLEPPKPAVNLPKNQPTNLESPATPVPGSVKVRSESGKTVVLKLDGAKSKFIPHIQRRSTENPAPLKTYCKSTKHPNFVHYVRDNGKQYDDPSMKPAKSNPPAADVPDSAGSKHIDIEPPQGKDVRSTREGIVSPRVSSSPIVFKIDTNGHRWVSLVNQSSNAKNTQLLKIVGSPKTQKAGVSTVQKQQPVTYLDAPMNSSDASDLSVGSSLPKATVEPHRPSTNDRTPSESTASKPVMAPFKAITSRPQPVLQVATQRSEPPVKPNNAVVLDHTSANSSKESESAAPKPMVSPFKITNSGPQPVFQVSIPPQLCSVSIPVSTRRSGAPAFARIEKPGSVSVPNLLQKRLAFSNGSKPQGCRVLKVVKPTQAPAAAASALHPGVTVLRPVSAFRNPITTSSDVSEVDDVVKSIVRDMVDFVCQKETFPMSFPYDSPMEPETPCLTIPCGKEQCRLGCVCMSLSKKSIRRARCKKLECIFRCVCDMRNPAVFQSRHATSPIHRRKQILGSCDNSIVPKAPARSILIKAPKVFSSLPEEPNHSATFLKAPMAYSSLLDEQIHSATPPKTPKVSCCLSKALKLCSVLPKPVSSTLPKPRSMLPKMVSSTISNSSSPSLVCSMFPESNKVNLTPADLPAPTPRRFFGREKVPIPEQALICLTPGFGYVPLEEISSTKVTVRDPFHSGKTKGFLNVRQATEWLNSTIQSLLSYSGTNLRWVVANKTMIESKQLHRLNMETLKSTKCTPTQNSAICAQQKIL